MADRIDTDSVNTGLHPSVERVLRAVVHALNNQLSVMASCSRFLSEDLPPDSPSLQDAEDIEQAAQTATDLVVLLASFGRLHATPYARPFPVEALTRSLSPLLMAVGGSPEAQVEVEVSEGDGLLRGDRHHYCRILYGLVWYAVQAAPAGTVVQVAFRPVPSGWLLEVTHEGEPPDPSLLAGTGADPVPPTPGLAQSVALARRNEWRIERVTGPEARLRLHLDSDPVPPGRA